MELHIIAHAHNGFSQKFGIPRQSREESIIETRIVFTPRYRVREALRGIDEFSHLWLLWGFHEANKPIHASKDEPEEHGKDLDWSPTVRPPRLGGNKRMGVFATRSPFRPNPIGLTSVRLIGIEESPEEGLVLVVTGADLLDGTPIYDIKPYLSFSDSHPNAKNGFAEATKDYHLSIDVDEEQRREAVSSGCPWEVFEEILSQDPRPAYQDDPNRLYHIEYNGWEITFQIKDATVCIKKIQQISAFFTHAIARLQ